MKALITATVLTLASTTVQAMDGKLVKDWCGRADQRSLATIYVSGTIDTLMEDLGPANVNVCIPAKLSRATVTDITCEWLEAHPEQWPKSAAASTLAALKAEYPCH